MRRSQTFRISVRWPFWLLVVAWVCANGPQAATYAVLSWLHSAPSFKHQQRLTKDVVSLLTHRGAHAAVKQGATQVPARPLAPVPDEAVLKRLDLSCERVVEVASETSGASRVRAPEELCPPSRRPAPPHDPPRWV
jgi:hypothetical protein